MPEHPNGRWMFEMAATDPSPPDGTRHAYCRWERWPCLLPPDNPEHKEHEWGVLVQKFMSLDLKYDDWRYVLPEDARSEELIGEMRGHVNRRMIYCAKCGRTAAEIAGQPREEVRL